MSYEKRKRFLINTLYILLILLIAYIIVKHALGLIAPFLFAFMIAYLLKRPARLIASKLKLPYKPVSFLMILIFYCVIVLLISFLGVGIVTFLTDFLTKLPVLYTTYLEPALLLVFERIEHAVYRMDPALVSTLSRLFSHFTQSIGDFSSALSLKAVSAISGFASALPQLFISVLLMVISSFFMIGDYDLITGFMIRQFPETGREFLLQIKEYIIGTLWVCIRSYALIMSITFLELSVGFTLIGVKNSVIIAFCVAIFDILPVLGTGGIMIPWTVISLIQGNLPLAAGLLAVYLIVTVIRNIIEPKIVGSQIGLHPVVTLMSLFVGAQLFGVIGLFGFPILLSLLVHLNKTHVIRLFR